MEIWMQRGIILGVFCLLLSSCSPLNGSVNEPKDQGYLSHMVMDAQAYQSCVDKPCQKTAQCQVPLVCQQGRCVVPPAITGKVSSDSAYVEVNGNKIWVEVVDDTYTMQLGLMMRRSMREDWGMLFVYPDQGKRAFWMQNTYIPLDIVFIRSDGSVSNVSQGAEPLNDVPRYLSTDRVQYVLELNAGLAKRYGIESGSQVKWTGVKR